jgi:hypothetical protein
VKAHFLTELCVRLIDDDCIWEMALPLIYESDIVGRIEVPQCFQTDFASVPRIPIAYRLYGDRAHRESVLHDYLYRSDSVPQATYSQANKVFLEAMEVRGKPWYVRYAMYAGVVAGGFLSYHRRKVWDRL